MWCRAMLWGLRVFAGLGIEVRGTPPAAATLIAAKHMSMWDTIALFLLLDRPHFVLKRELLRIPFYGWYVRNPAWWRSTARAALRPCAKWRRRCARVIDSGHAVIIFPEGTRKKPGAEPDYKPGVAGLYGQLGATACRWRSIPACYWTGSSSAPARSIVEFLPAIPAGLPAARIHGHAGGPDRNRDGRHWWPRAGRPRRAERPLRAGCIWNV